MRQVPMHRYFTISPSNYYSFPLPLTHFLYLTTQGRRKNSTNCEHYAEQILHRQARNQKTKRWRKIFHICGHGNFWNNKEWNKHSDWSRQSNRGHATVSHSGKEMYSKNVNSLCNMIGSNFRLIEVPNMMNSKMLDIVGFGILLPFGSVFWPNFSQPRSYQRKEKEKNSHKEGEINQNLEEW